VVPKVKVKFGGIGRKGRKEAVLERQREEAEERCEMYGVAPTPTLGVQKEDFTSPADTVKTESDLGGRCSPPY
jgi:hypothetical protein